MMKLNEMKWDNVHTKNEKIWELIWTGNNIGYEGARMISESLKTNTTLTKLELNGDEIEVNQNKEKSKRYK